MTVLPAKADFYLHLAGWRVLISNPVCMHMRGDTILRSIRLPRMLLFHCQMVTEERLGEEKHYLAVSHANAKI